jgi:hypothetical protein
MTYIKLFEEFVAENTVTSADIEVDQSSWVPVSELPNYEWTSELENWVWAASKTRKNWSVQFTIPGVANFSLGVDGVKINQIAALMQNKFSVGQGTNFDSSVVGRSWYKKRGDILNVFSILVKNCTRAAYAPTVKTDLTVSYMKGLSFAEGEHIFDPSSSKGDLINWVDYAPNILYARGTFKREPKLEDALKRISAKIPKTIVLKCTIED